MPVPFRYTVRVDTPGIDKAPEIYAFYVQRHLEKLGEEIQGDVRGEQRIDTGQERRGTRFKLVNRRQGYATGVSIYNSLIQANVDETGAKPHFPPYRKGSKLYKWTERKGLGGFKLLASQARALGQLQGRGAGAAYNRGIEKQTERVSFLIARAQSRRGLPRPGDVLRAPFKDVEARKRGYIRQSFSIPFALATMRINSMSRAGARA